MPFVLRNNFSAKNIVILFCNIVFLDWMENPWKVNSNHAEYRITNSSELYLLHVWHCTWPVVTIFYIFHNHRPWSRGLNNRSPQLDVEKNMNPIFEIKFDIFNYRINGLIDLYMKIFFNYRQQINWDLCVGKWKRYQI